MAHTKRKYLRPSFAVLVAASMSTATLAMPALAVKGKGDQVTICHRTNATKNPYTVITVDRSSVDGAGGKGDHYLNHRGPVWTPDQRNGGDWGDIIPPIPGFHDGLNWDEAGIAIYNNGCEPVAPQQQRQPEQPPGDVDDDGTPDSTDPDDDNDNIPDSDDPDDDNDGTPDDQDPDQDDADNQDPGDEDTPDTDQDPGEEDVPDTDDGDQDPGTDDVDVDLDGTPDSQDPDDDNDGTPDTKDPDDDNDGTPDRIDPDSPETPVMVVAPDEAPRAGKTFVVRVNTLGRSTVQADCVSRGQKANEFCTVKVKNSAVRVRATCNEKMAVQVTARATANSMRTAEVRRTIKLAQKPFVACAVKGRG